jgi:glycosyltransferase involved in cell wall biosynthesis
MKLLLVITDYGSFNNFLSELVLEMSKDPSFELIIICSKTKVIEIKDKNVFNSEVKFHFIDIPRKITLTGEWKAAKKIRQVINIENPDLVHSHFTTATLPVIFFKKKLIPYWATIHGLGMNSTTGFKKVIFILVEMFSFWRLSKIYTINEQDTNLVKKYFKAKIKKYDCLGIGCDINKFCNDNIPKSITSQIREKYNLRQDHIIIAFTGRFVKFKGFDLVIKSFKILNERYPDKFKLILMGGIDSIHQMGLTDEEIIFLNTNQDIVNVGFTNNVENYLSLTDIFLFPSKKEGLPICVLEALSMGVPVVTFNSRGNNDVIKNEYNGLLLEPDNNIDKEIDKIISSLEWMKVNKDKYNQFKINALNNRNYYSRDRFVKEQIEYYTNFKNDIAD